MPNEKFKNVTLMNNAFMNLVLEDNIPCVEEILRIIMEKYDLKVMSAQTQKLLQGFSRSICLDVFAEDSEGVLYNIEVQKEDKGADPRRARFHAGMIDAHALKAGQDFKELPELYFIFITQNDVIGLNKVVYRIQKYIDLDGEFKPFNDGAHIVYVNCSAQRGDKEALSDIWKLIHDLQTPDPNEMYLPVLAERVKFLKGRKEGENEMLDYFEQREANAIADTAKKIAASLLGSGLLSQKDIAKHTGLSLYRVRKLAKTLKTE